MGRAPQTANGAFAIMITTKWTRGIALLAVCGVATALTTTVLQAQQAATLSALEIGAKAPAGASVLLDGTVSTLKANWFKRYTKNDAGWTVSDGAYNNDGSDITSKKEYGDCTMFVEFRTPKTGDGNAGVSFQGRYEIQIFENFGKTPDKHNSAALYDQRPANINACKPAGEWQSYLIIFRAPRFDANGAVTEKARATVIHNGVIVQNNESFTGPTGIQYREYKGEAPKGPLSLQGDHGKVQFRNLWVVEG